MLARYLIAASLLTLSSGASAAEEPVLHWTCTMTSQDSEDEAGRVDEYRFRREGNTLFWQDRGADDETPLSIIVENEVGVIATVGVAWPDDEVHPGAMTQMSLFIRHEDGVAAFIIDHLNNSDTVSRSVTSSGTCAAS